jgi:hypothetical protein
MFVLGGALVAGAEETPCRLQPTHLRITLPSEGLRWLEGEARSGPCAATSQARAWGRGTGSNSNAIGPVHETERWQVWLSWQLSKDGGPYRGICFTAPGQGSRMLPTFREGSLPWSLDLDDDGVPEALLWDAFPVTVDSRVEYGRVAWVYRAGTDGALTLDWALTRKIARELAAAYEAAPPAELAWAAGHRRQAARVLDGLVADRCETPRS